ncbi:MAG: alpha/beta fold hydrolase [Bacteroidota bacterium]
MNEASSKYVDQIAIQKLLKEKLTRVHHSPGESGSSYDTGFEDFATSANPPNGVRESKRDSFTELSFRSSLSSKYEESNQVRCRVFPAKEPTGEILFVHGLYEDNMQIYDFFIALLNEQGMNVYLLVLPFHYKRKPGESTFSGEFFWSADVDRSAFAFKQAVYDLAQLYQYVKARTGRKVWIVGFSMGGGVALRLASLLALDGVFVINPVCNITELMWNSPLFSTIKADLEENNQTFDMIKERYSQLEPLNVGDVEISRENVVLGKGLYDQINDPANYDLLAERWGVKHVLSYKAGHLNILRVPKMAVDIARFYAGEGAQ